MSCSGAISAASARAALGSDRSALCHVTSPSGSRGSLETAYPMAGRRQRGERVAADEAAGARDEDAAHRRVPRSSTHASSGTSRSTKTAPA